jgi:hypothetical protein
MRVAILITWLLLGGIGVGDWWDAATASVDTTESADVQKMDGGSEPPAKP